MKTDKLGGRLWFNLALFSLMGQIAWNVENMFFNTFLYNSIYHGTSQAAIDGSIDVVSAINIMVSASAITAVVTTFIMGTLSDKINKRKLFISAGYIAWGIVTALFGVISRERVAAAFSLSDETKILTYTVACVIVLDCVMTFMGSTSNDSAFNAWVTDVTTPANRQKVESLFAALPIAAMGIVMGLGGVIIAKLGYQTFFISLGALVAICGVIGLFTLEDSRSGIKQNSNYWSDLFYGFRPSVIRENKLLYFALSSIGLFGVAVQVFFPYLIIYLQHVILPTTDNLFSAANIVCLLISALIMGGGIITLLKFSNKIGRENVLFASSASFVIGLFLLGFTHSIALTLLAVAPVVVGYAVLLIVLNASIRDLTPEDKVGQFQGIRMIFYVLIPMIIGPLLGNIACRYSDITYINEYGIEKIVPSSLMFIFAAAVAVIVFLPVWAMHKIKLPKVESSK